MGDLIKSWEFVYQHGFNIPAGQIAIIVLILAAMQVIGKLMEFYGKTAPAIMRIFSYFKEKKAKEIARDKDIADIKEAINKLIQAQEASEKKLDKTYDMSLSNRIENMRSAILSFATKISGENAIVATSEQFKEIMRLYDDYESLIEDNGRTNGQVEIAYHIITEEYEKRIRNNMFLENIRGLR